MELTEVNKKIKNICDFYVITQKLKNTLRTGWVIWKISADRIESVAEHIYGTQMLAFVINSEFELGLDIAKLSLMLAIHELGETVIGDIALDDILAKKITREEKQKIEMQAVLKILKPLNCKEILLETYNEFEQCETKEAKFARVIDRLEACFQCKCYEENGYSDYTTTMKGEHEKLRQERIAKGWTTLAKAWIENNKQVSDFDELYNSLSDYLLDNNIFKKPNKKGKTKNG